MIDNFVNDIKAFNNQQFPWLKGSILGTLSHAIQSISDIYDKEKFEILYESKDIYNIIEGLDNDCNTYYKFYFLKTKHSSKIIGIVTQQEDETDAFQVIYQINIRYL